MLDLVRALALVCCSHRLEVIRLLENGVVLRTETLPLRGDLDAMSAESLQNRPACVRRELEASTAVELVHGTHQRHVAFADEIGKVDFCEPDAFGHCQDQCEIGLRELLAVLHRDGVPTQNGSSLAKGERSASRFLLDLRDLKAREVVLHEKNPLLSAREQNR